MKASTNEVHTHSHQRANIQYNKNKNMDCVTYLREPSNMRCSVAWDMRLA